VRTCTDRRSTPLHIREVRFRAANNHSRTSVVHHKDWLLGSPFEVSEMKLLFLSTPISSYILQSSVSLVLCESHFTNPVFFILCSAYLFYYYVSYSSCLFVFFVFFSVFFPLIPFVFHFCICSSSFYILLSFPLQHFRFCPPFSFIVLSFFVYSLLFFFPPFYFVSCFLPVKIFF
jgi:hypothetical protein